MTRWLLSLAVLVAACTREPARPRATESAKDQSHVYLDEWFTLRGGRCRVSHATAQLTESERRPFAEARVKPDVRAVDVSLACETAKGAVAHSRDVLPVDLAIALRTGAGKERAPLPLAQDDERDHLVFELPGEGRSPLLARRRYDATTGQPTVERERAVATLHLRSQTRSIEVTLRPRFRDARFDALLDQLARKLANAGDASTPQSPEASSDALSALIQTFGDVRARFLPARLELANAAADDAGNVRVTLSLNRPQRRARSFEVARFDLVLRESNEGFVLVDFANRDEARAALKCAELEERPEEWVGPRRAEESALCNVAGSLLPGTCGTLEPKLVERVLKASTACRSSRELSRAPVKSLPGDFQLTMRRGRTTSGLDRSPRYVVALFANGHVAFHGRHFVGAEGRSDGRTDRALVAGLYEHLTKLDWFARRGGQFTAELCIPSEDLGDVITVVARDRQRMVLNRDGCRGPFSESELTGLRRRVELVAGVDAWTQPRPAYVDEGVTHWTVEE